MTRINIALLASLLFSACAVETSEPDGLSGANEASLSQEVEALPGDIEITAYAWYETYYADANYTRVVGRCSQVCESRRVSCSGSRSQYSIFTDPGVC